MMTAAKPNKNVSKPTTPTAAPATAEAKAPAAPAAVEVPVTPAVAPAAETKPATPSKAQMTLMRLSVELAKRDVKVEPSMLKMDGKFLVLQIGDAWPRIQIGPGGGIDLPQIKSYPRAFEAAVEGDKLLAKQNAKGQPKPATAAAAQPEPKKEEVAETPAQRKQREDAALEQKLDAQSAA
jgi:hypothetical protein